MNWLEKLIHKKPIQIVLLSITILFFVFVGIPFGMMIAYWNDLPSLAPLDYETHSWQYPTEVYSDILRVSPGVSLDNILKRLKRLNYRQVNSDIPDSGQFYLTDNEMKLYLRELNYPRMFLPSRPITLPFISSLGRATTLTVVSAA